MAEFFTLQPEMDIFAPPEHEWVAFVQPEETTWDLVPFENLDTWPIEEPLAQFEQAPAPSTVEQPPQPEAAPPPLPPAPNGYVPSVPTKTDIKTWRARRSSGIRQHAGVITPTRPKPRKAPPVTTPMTPEMRLRERVGMLDLHLHHSVTPIPTVIHAVETLQVINHMRFEEIRHHATTIRISMADSVDIRDVIYLIAANCHDKSEINTFIEAAIKLIKQKTGME